MENNLNEKDFDEFYSTYATLVMNVAMIYLKDEYYAEDIMQEVMFKVYTIPKDKKIESGYAWIAKITRNMCLNFLKKMKFECASDEVMLMLDMMETEEAILLDAEKIYFQEQYEDEITELCEDVFEELTRKKYEKWYEAVRAIYQGGETGKETAKRLNMTENAFYAMLARLRSRMKKLYGARYEDIGKA